MKTYRYLLWVSLLLSSWSVAELNVIADLGGESAIRFYEGLQPEQDETAPSYPNAIPETVTEDDMLPVVSHQLTPGKVKSMAFELPGMSPIFLIGADNLSRQWLSQHYKSLLSQQAVGLVVNVTTVDELNQLRHIAPDLSLLPTPADDLSKRLKLSHYPALITETGIYQ